MSDRGFLFLFSLLMIVAGVGAAIWLVVTGQAATVDGLFLVLTALVVALVFVLYIVYMVRREMEAAAAPPAAPAKAAPQGSTAAKSPTPATQS